MPEVDKQPCHMGRDIECDTQEAEKEAGKDLKKSDPDFADGLGKPDSQNDKKQ